MKIVQYMTEMTYRYENYLRSNLGKMNLPDHKINIIGSSISDHLCECDAFIRCQLIYNYDSNPADSRIKTVSFGFMKKLYELFRDTVELYCSRYKTEYDYSPGVRDSFLRTIQMLDLRLGGVSRERP